MKEGFETFARYFFGIMLWLVLLSPFILFLAGEPRAHRASRFDDTTGFALIRFTIDALLGGFRPSRIGPVALTGFPRAAGGFVERMNIDVLQIVDQQDFQKRIVRHGLDDSRNGIEFGEFGGAQPPMSGGDLKAVG